MPKLNRKQRQALLKRARAQGKPVRVKFSDALSHYLADTRKRKRLESAIKKLAKIKAGMAGLNVYVSHDGKVAHAADCAKSINLRHDCTCGAEVTNG